MFNTTIVNPPVIIGGGSRGCSGYYEKWTTLKDGSQGCRPLMWEEMDEYLTWRWWTYKVYLPVGIPLGIIGLIILSVGFVVAVVGIREWRRNRKI